jgi:16S rRNA (uracil1498-N3)-methyltransferase
MSRRFFVPPPIHADLVLLEGPEAHHLLHVMRAKQGDQVELFDGTGWEFMATLQQVERKRAWLRIDARRRINRELPCPLVLAVALPRGDRQEWLVEKAVELGVTRLVPWRTEHSVARLRQQTLPRLQRTVIEASKQCGRNQLMEIAPPCEFAEFLATASERLSVLAHVPDANRPTASVATVLNGLTDNGVQLGIGPEGGFSPREAEQAVAAGWRLVGLGPRLLRSETAALALAAQVIARFDERSAEGR